MAATADRADQKLVRARLAGAAGGHSRRWSCARRSPPRLRLRGFGLTTTERTTSRRSPCSAWRGWPASRERSASSLDLPIAFNEASSTLARPPPPASSPTTHWRPSPTLGDARPHVRAARAGAALDAAIRRLAPRAARAGAAARVDGRLTAEAADILDVKPAALKRPPASRPGLALREQLAAYLAEAMDRRHPRPCSHRGRRTPAPQPTRRFQRLPGVTAAVSRTSQSAASTTTRCSSAPGRRATRAGDRARWRRLSPRARRASRLGCTTATQAIAPGTRGARRYPLDTSTRAMAVGARRRPDAGAQINAGADSLGRST
jgi:hypothetical protein